jgi:hypothetical protein
MAESQPLSPLEEALRTAMRAIDNQIAREMQRTPEEMESHGAQKWDPLDKRIELVTSFVLNSLGESETQLDSLLVLSQAFAKSLRLITDDLEADGLGKLRSQYCKVAFERIAEDARKGLTHFFASAVIISKLMAVLRP